MKEYFGSLIDPTERYVSVEDFIAENKGKALGFTFPVEYVGFIFESTYHFKNTCNASGVGYVKNDASIDNVSMIVNTEKLTVHQILNFCNAVNVVARTGELTDEQFEIFCKNFQSRYGGQKFILFVSSQLIPTDGSLKSKLLWKKIKELCNYENLSAGRERAVDAIIDTANEIRILDDCEHKNVAKNNSPHTYYSPSVESASADYPHQVQALTGVCVPDTVDGHQEDIEDSDGSVPDVNVTNTEPIPVRDSGVAKDMLWALTMVDHPDEKIRHWAKSQSGVGNTDIAKSENPTWEQEFGESQANEMWASEGERIRMQVRSVDNMLNKRNNPTKRKKAK